MIGATRDGLGASEDAADRQIAIDMQWGMDTDAGTLSAAEIPGLTSDRARESLGEVRRPVLVVHGTDDAVIPPETGAEAARRTGGRMVSFDSSGPGPRIRDPVRFNLVLNDFLASLPVRMEAGSR